VLRIHTSATAVPGSAASINGSTTRASSSNVYSSDVNRQ
jgi:hypothetical protein